MKRLSKLAPAALAVLFVSAAAAHAQRPRVTADTPAASTAPTPAPAPQSVKAKYEGGVTGFMQKQTGTLQFNDDEKRLLFRDKTGREYFSLPYDALAAIWPDKKARRTTTGTVVSNIPLPYGANMLGLLMREKVRYLVVQYDDPDTRVTGVTSFKLDSQQLLTSVLHTLAGKAELKQRGDGFVRTQAAVKTDSK
jgi:hypothetical protein